MIQSKGFIVSGIALAGFLAVLAGPVLSRGVSNGAIEGVVFSTGGQPVAGANVVAVRQEEPPIIRNARTDQAGRFHLPGLYVGSYTLGVSKFGFRTITTESGDPANRTALGDQIRTFVEPGRTSSVGSIRLTPQQGSFASTVTVFVTDRVTGEPVNDASVIVGPVASSGPGAGGQYTLVLPPITDEAGNSRPQRALVQADGFVTAEQMVTPISGANQSVFVRLAPTTSLIMGRVQLGFGIPPNEITSVRIQVENVAPDAAQGRVLDLAGNFQVSLPASTARRARVFTLLFMLGNTRMARVTSVVSPRAGARTLPQTIVLQPETGVVAGQVVLSDGTLPVGGQTDRVVVLELGQAFPMVNGNFQIPSIPLGRTFNLQVQAFNVRTRRVELGRTSFTAISGGAGSPVFRLPLIVTGMNNLSAFPTPF